MAALKAVPPAAAEASESARLAVGLKRELIDLVKARDYVAALAVCEKRTARPRPLRAPLLFSLRPPRRPRPSVVKARSRALRRPHASLLPRFST